MQCKQKYSSNVVCNSVTVLAKNKMEKHTQIVKTVLCMVSADDIYYFLHHSWVSNSQFPLEIAANSQQRKYLQQPVAYYSNETEDGSCTPLHRQYLALRWLMQKRRRDHHGDQTERTLQWYFWQLVERRLIAVTRQNQDQYDRHSQWEVPSEEHFCSGSCRLVPLSSPFFSAICSRCYQLEFCKLLYHPGVPATVTPNTVSKYVLHFFSCKTEQIWILYMLPSGLSSPWTTGGEMKTAGRCRGTKTRHRRPYVGSVHFRGN